MKNIRIEDLSAIQQRKNAQQSIDELPQKYSNSRILCHNSKNQNYSCPICNRLRKICPYSKNNACKHTYQGNYKRKPDISMYSKANQSVSFNDRMKTFSTIQSRNQSGNRQSNVHISPSKHNAEQNGNWSQKRIQTEVRFPQTQEIIFFPVVHNKLITQTSPNTAMSTPTRKSRNRRDTQIREDIVLTPTQFKQMMQSFRS